MACAVRRGGANLRHRCFGVADRGNATAFVKEAAEFQRTFAFGSVGENADEAVGTFPELRVFARIRIAQAFDFVAAAFGGIEIGAFDVDAQKIWMSGAATMLVTKCFKAGRHL